MATNIEPTHVCQFRFCPKCNDSQKALRVWITRERETGSVLVQVVRIHLVCGHFVPWKP